MFEEQGKKSVLNENSVERKPFTNRESKSDELTIWLYSFHDINMNFLVVVTPPYIYHVVYQQCILKATDFVFTSLVTMATGCSKYKAR